MTPGAVTVCFAVKLTLVRCTQMQKIPDIRLCIYQDIPLIYSGPSANEETFLFLAKAWRPHTTCRLMPTTENNALDTPCGLSFSAATLTSEYPLYRERCPQPLKSVYYACHSTKSKRRFFARVRPLHLTVSTATDSLPLGLLLLQSFSAFLMELNGGSATPFRSPSPPFHFDYFTGVHS